MPIDFVVFKEDKALCTSDSDMLISVIVESGIGNSSRGGKLKKLCVKTEWKKVLNIEALSPSNVAVEESKVTVGGIVP